MMPESEPGPALERISKFLSRAGIASRRGAEDLVREGRVSVNGGVIEDLGHKVDPDCDRVSVDGREVSLAASRTYLLLNKPPGIVTTLDDPQGRPTVARFVPAGASRLFPVGRLDMNTTGLLILTDDGDFAHLLMHPRHHVPKKYHATVDGVPDENDLQQLRDGLVLDDGPTAPAEARLVEAGEGSATVELIIREGRKRQVRRMLSAIGHPVFELKRVAYGPIELGALAEGEVRTLADDEVAALRDSAGDA